MTIKTEETLLRKVSKDAVYDCKEVITDKAQTRLDYAVVRLDRPVKGRSILKMNKSGGITIGEDVFTIGHPLGMPTKLVDDAVVTNVSSKYLFTTNLDTFMGNSGSPVFNSKGVVEGILVRGKRDFAEDYDRSIGVCHTLNRCDEDGRNCTEPSSSTGEEVVSLEVIFEDIKKDGFDLGI